MVAVIIYTADLYLLDHAPNLQVYDEPDKTSTSPNAADNDERKDSAQ